MAKSKDTTSALELPDNRLALTVYGEHNSHLQHIEQMLDVTIADRGNRLAIKGESEAVELAEAVLNDLIEKARKSKTGLELQDVTASLRFIKTDSLKKGPHKMADHYEDEKMPSIKLSKKELSARTPNQAAYIKALKKHDMIFGLGPAGTGKTYLAVGMAVHLYEQGQVERMIFCRPAVEAGEKLGFLPGDMREKIDPYLSPIYDALYDFLGREKTEKLMERNDIEIAPLAFMRGRTLSEACVVLDEAQNTTSAQMKMFLSRMGEGSKMIITGDPHQVDLLENQISGLKEAATILRDINEVSFIEFNHDDVVRHSLVSKILKAYDRFRHGY
ncbi:MAG: PhoH family protein [Pseudobdellovibrionaceae bacterium]